jgi:hypothetical protein
MSINDGANALGSSNQIEVIVATAAMTGDNSKGLALAISSSLFIGASFIIKKKGLKKAGSTGMRAGEWHVEINVASEVRVPILHCFAARQQAFSGPEELF